MTPFASYLKSVLLIVTFFSISKNTLYSQCVEIESILVAACGTPEGQNEMFRFRVGPTALNSGDMAINWPSNTWEGFIQNATTASKVAILNANIVAAGGCALILEPVGGVLPANAPVIVVTSYLFDTAANSFGALTENTYILFQNSTATGGHFGNYQPTGTRTLSISFGPGCVDTVTYTRNLLSQTSGAAVNFTAAGAATYFNNGCSAPVEPFTVDAGPPSITTCAGTVLNFTGTAQGYTSLQWSSSQGTLSSTTTLSTTLTIPTTASGIFAVTLNALNACGASVIDVVTIFITPGGTPTFSLPSTICLGQTAPILPTSSNNGISGTWLPPIVSNTTSGAYIFTPSSNSCASPFTLDVTVVTGTITPLFSAVNAICAGTTLAPLPTISNNGITGTWSPALNNTTTTIYTFTPNSGQCATTTTLTIVVDPSTTPTFTAVDPICAGDTLALLPITSLNNITGIWSPALNNTTTTTYTFTPDAGQCALPANLTITVNPILTPTFNLPNSICEGENLAALPTTSQNGVVGTWSPNLNNLATTTYTFEPNDGQCAVSVTATIIVTPTVVPTFSSVSPICQGGPLAALPTTSQNGVFGTWSPALNNSTTTTYTFTPSAGQCATTQTMEIIVNPNVTPTFTAVSPICNGENLAILPITSNNGITGTWSPALNNTTSTTYTFLPNTNQCANNATLTITVDPIVTPTFATINPICESDIIAPLPLTSQNGITGTWSPILNNTTTTTYTFTPNSGQCANNATLTIVVNNAGTVTPITGNNSVCIGDTLALANATPGGTWSSNNPNVATVDNNGLVTPLTPGFARIIYTTASVCTLVFIDITVYLPPNPLLADKFICVDKVTGNYLNTVNLQCGVENANHTFVWTLNGQALATITNLHVATEEGLYEVRVTNNTTGCSATASANVTKSSIAIAEATVAQDFDLNQIITVTVTGGSGNYEYQLDNNWPQSSNQFTVQQGEYTITVIDKNGCGVEKLSVFALNYPRYFTPNLDGFNDTWSIEGLNKQQEAQIFIFDRYGKLIKAIKPYLSEFWDGTLNGSPLPATDYWFTLNYINKDGLSKEFRSHFTLKR